MLLEQLYYMYYNTRPKSAPKGVTIVCFHPNGQTTPKNFQIEGIFNEQTCKCDMMWRLGCRIFHVQINQDVISQGDP
jgi:hypothetical protein